MNDYGKALLQEANSIINNRKVILLALQELENTISAEQRREDIVDYIRSQIKKDVANGVIDTKLIETSYGPYLYAKTIIWKFMANTDSRLEDVIVSCMQSIYNHYHCDISLEGEIETKLKKIADRFEYLLNRKN